MTTSQSRNCALLLIGAFGISLANQSFQERNLSADTVEARSFVLRGEDGSVRARLQAEGDSVTFALLAPTGHMRMDLAITDTLAGFRLYDADGHPSALITSDGEESTIALVSESGSNIGLGITPEGKEYLRLHDAGGNHDARLSATELMFARESIPRLAAGINQDGTEYLTLRDAGEEGRAWLSAGRIEIAGGRQAAALGIDQGGDAALLLSNGEQGGLSATSSADGSSAVVMVREGNLRTALEVSGDGSAILRMADAQGRLALAQVVDPRGDAGLRISHPDQGHGMRLFSGAESVGAIVYASGDRGEEQGRIALGFDAGRTTALRLADGDGRERVVLEAPRGGNTGLLVNDTEGRKRAEVAVDADGVTVLRVVDAEGKDLIGGR